MFHHYWSSLLTVEGESMGKFLFGDTRYFSRRESHSVNTLEGGLLVVAWETHCDARLGVNPEKDSTVISSETVDCYIYYLVARTSDSS